MDDSELLRFVLQAATMKIGCLQFDPKLGEWEKNQAKASSLLEDVSAGDLDLVVLPEMAFSGRRPSHSNFVLIHKLSYCTGYNFPSLEAVTPFLEPTASGRTTEWAKTVALRLKCNVTVGYPEITATEPRTRYNALVTVSPTGDVLCNYRKSFLYYTDEVWASEGDAGFYHGPLGNLGDVCMGICMDINNYRFEAPLTAYEFATHCLGAKVKLVVLSMAWLTHLTPEAILAEPEAYDPDTLAYWVSRFAPLIEAKGEEEIVVIFANRCGMDPGRVLPDLPRDLTEDGREVVPYAGSSCVLSFQDGRIRYLDGLGRAEERLLVVDTEKASPLHVSLHVHGFNVY